MSAVLKWLCVAVAIPVVVLATISGAYLYGASALPATLAPSSQEYPSGIRRMYWQSLGGSGEVKIRRLNPLTIAWAMFRMVEDTGDGRIKPAPPDLQALTSVAGIRMSGVEPRLPTLRRALAEIALMIRISREWNSRQVLDTALAEQWFGRDARGLDRAANTYFGVAIDNLSPEEAPGLVVLERGPSHFDPTCHRDRFDERYEVVAKLAGMPGGKDAIGRATARLRMIDCP